MKSTVVGTIGDVSGTASWQHFRGKRARSRGGRNQRCRPDKRIHGRGLQPHQWQDWRYHLWRRGNFLVSLNLTFRIKNLFEQLGRGILCYRNSEHSASAIKTKTYTDWAGHSRQMGHAKKPLELFNLLDVIALRNLYAGATRCFLKKKKEVAGHDTMIQYSVSELLQ